MNYHFFDYKYNIQNFHSDLFSTTHIIYIILAVISIILLGYFLRNVNHKKLSIFLKILAIFTLIFEITKISWESYYDISRGDGFNFGGILPIYACSLLIYCLIGASFTKGMIRETCLSWLSTIGLVCGMIGVIYTNGLNYYPFWTFGAFYSLFFHYALLLVGVILLTTGYKKLEWKDIYISLIPIVALALIATPINYIVGSDYMQIQRGSSVPLMEDLAKFLGEHHMRPLFNILMIAAYMIPSALVISIYKLVMYLKTYKKTSNNFKQA